MRMQMKEPQHEEAARQICNMVPYSDSMSSSMFMRKADGQPMEEGDLERTTELISKVPDSRY